MDALAIRLFDADTAVTAHGDGRYTAICSGEWAAPAGPNGGYVAAIIARAVVEEVADAQRSLRSLTVQFLRPPTAGESLDITVVAERVGRTVTNLTVRAAQHGRLMVLGVAIAGLDQAVALDYATVAPVMPRPDEVPTLSTRVRGGSSRIPAIAHRYEIKPCLGADLFSGADTALTGGWIRLHEKRPLDVLAAVAFLDAWLPAPFTRVTAPVIAPTLDYTVHIRAPLPVPGLDPASFVMLRMSSTTSSHGYFEGDCEIWSPDGVLLAQARQLALLAPLPPRPS